MRQTAAPLAASLRFVALGSCFSEAIGGRLADGGVDIAVNPMGVLFNPCSIASIVERALEGRPFGTDDLYVDEGGVSHALAFESRRQGTDSQALIDRLNNDFTAFAERLRKADCWLITFGTAWCFRHIPSDRLVGNCHKLPDKDFERFLVSVDKIEEQWNGILKSAPRVIFTVSPVRHLNDGLHGNTLSKARLHLAVENLCRNHPNAEYFPAFEALNDDLRDYRFYADDMKHPSALAEQYIFELFEKCYFTKDDIAVIERNRRAKLQSLHRPIIL